MHVELAEKPEIRIGGSRWLCWGLLWFLFCLLAKGQTIDTIIFGNSASETTHGLVSNKTEAVAGQLGQSARRCLPLDVVEENGGDLTFTMAVDPVRRNHVSVKLWGGDDTDIGMGRLYLYVPINGANYQVGYRHEGDYMPLSVTHGHPPLPGRFFYSTTLLPLAMTRGRTSITLKIVSTGRLYPFGSGGPGASSPYQYAMDRASRGIYRAYTHIDPFLDVSGETQGIAPSVTTRSSPGEGTMAPGGAFHTGVNNRINNRLNTSVSVGNFSTGDVAYLARSYSVSGLPGFQNQAVVDKVVAVLDAYATNYYANPSSVQGWGGNSGPLGRGILYLQGQLTPATLDTVVDYGTAGGSKTRRAAWGDMLHASREYGRLSSRNSLTNQSTIANENIYCANKGLLVIGDSRAFPEDVAQRYLKEACGLLPWLGEDLADANGNGLPDDGSEKPFGSNYYQVTGKGMTREWGFVSASYGELAFQVAGWYRLNGNTVFRDQAAKMAKASAVFRRPAIEVSGSSHYRSMEAISLLAWRGAWESDGNYAGFIAYADTADTGGGGRGMLAAAVCGDPALTGYAKQMLADNQFFPHLTESGSYCNTIVALESFADYQTIKNATDSGTRLPMTDGQPDFAWADEENGVMALKRGNDRLWVAPYWQAKSGTGINGIARFHYSAPNYDQYGVLETTPRFRPGVTYVRPNRIDMPEKTLHTPPNPPTNAYAGEILPVGLAPSDSSSDEPFRGKADFYTFRFGRYLIGLNAHESASYTLKTPNGFTSAADLVGGATRSGVITVAPRTTVALDLGVTSDAAPMPNSPLALTTTGSSAPSITLNWTAASGAESYTVKRSSTPGGPYTALPAGTGVATTTFIDTSVVAVGAYYYVVSASNANGEGDDSMEASASAGVPFPWVSGDLGAVGAAGSASYLNQSFKLSGAGTTVGGTADAFRFVYTPVTGDGAMVARVASRALSGTGSDKIGLMIRDGTAAGSKNMALMIDNGFSDQARMSFRSGTNGGTTYDKDGGGAAIPKYYVDLPYWLKVERIGSVCRSSISPDGIAWTTLGEVSLTMSATVNFGMFVCSMNTAMTVQGTFDGVMIPSIWETIPSAPTGLSVNGKLGGVSLSWTAPPETATSYRVRRASVSGGPYASITTVSTPSYQDTGLDPGDSYFYVVSAINALGESSDSAEAWATVPSKLSGTVIGTAGGWENNPNVAKEAVFDGNLASYFDPPLGTGYTAWVGLDLGSPRALTHIRFAPRSTHASRMLGGKFQGSNSADFASGVVDLHTITATPPVGVFTTVEIQSAPAFRYVRYLTAPAQWCNVAEIEFYHTQPQPPPAPVGVVAAGGTNSIMLNWGAVPDAASYTVKRGDSASGPFTTVASGIATTGYLDGGRPENTTYHYVVSASGMFGEGENSAAVAATTHTLQESWRQTHFGAAANTGNAADSADADGDGLANLLEYATATNPLAANGSPLKAVIENDSIALTFQRIADPALVYEIMASTDLVDWGAAPIWSSSGLQNAAGPVTAPGGETIDSGRRFLRLVVRK